jgi:uncharacterized protein (TIGR00255 family)
MIHSMTGFGEGTAAAEGIEARAELRSVNARHLDLKLRLPDTLRSKKSDAETLLKERFARGRLTVNVELEGAEDESALPVQVDDETAAAYARLLRRLADAAELDEGGDAPLRLEHLLHFSDVLEQREHAASGADAEAAWPAAREALEAAAGALQATRHREGEALRADLGDRLDAIAGGLDAVESRAPERVAERRERLEKRLGELFGDERVAADRLEAEVALVADKLDITEECVRLRSHLEQFEDALADEEPAGRRLKFLVQELHREANTIGAKANDPTVSRHAVSIKEEIEKVREQIRNVE